jgi:hypothetical protein
MAELKVSLSVDECEYLVNLLESTLKDALVEEHRTRAPTYRRDILQREEVIRTVLDKLRQPVA